MRPVGKINILTEKLARRIRTGDIEVGKGGKLTPKTPAGERQLKSSKTRRYGQHSGDEVAIGKETNSPNLKGTPEEMKAESEKLKENPRAGGGLHSHDSKRHIGAADTRKGKGSYRSFRGIKKRERAAMKARRQIVMKGDDSYLTRGDYKGIRKGLADKYSEYKANKSRKFSKKQSVKGTRWSRPGGFGSAPGRHVAVKPKEGGFKSWSKTLKAGKLDEVAPAVVAAARPILKTVATKVAVDKGTEYGKRGVNAAVTKLNARRLARANRQVN